MRKIRKTVLSNGLTILTAKKSGRTVAVQVTIKTGSLNEKKGDRGISHFLEHMCLEGTKTRTSLQIASEIEGLGGDISAFTTNEKTAFYVKVLSKHFEKGVEVLSDVIRNPIFDKKILEKERKIVLSEIKMVTDEPRFHQWVLFQKALYGEGAISNPVYGTVEDIKKMRRNDLFRYMGKYYTPSNMVISVAGNVNNPEKTIKKYFGAMKKAKKQEDKIRFKAMPGKRSEKRPIMQSYIVMGFNTVKRSHEDSYTLDVIRAILGKGLSGKLFQEIRQKRGLAYDVGVNNEAGFDYGFFSIYLSTDKKNIAIAISLAIQELQKLKSLSRKDIDEAKRFLEGEYIISNEENKEMADNLGGWELSSDVRDADKYVSRIRKVSKKDIARIVDKYFSVTPATAMIRQN